MTREEAIAIIRKEYLCVDRDCDIDRSCGKCDLMMPTKEPILKAYEMAIQALSQECVGSTQKHVEKVLDMRCDDLISRQAALNILPKYTLGESRIAEELRALPSVTHKSGKWINDECGNVICSECKRFRRDCRYGHTNYCNHCGAEMVEPQESEDKK